MKEAARPRNPIIPADTGDRTGTAGIRRRAAAVIRRRFDGVRRDLLAIFGRIRVYQTNDDDDERALYGTTPAELAQLSAEIQTSVDTWMDPGQADGLEPSWWDRYEEEAALLGAGLAVANLARLFPAYAATRPLTQVILSDAYRERLAAARFASREFWAGLASSLRSEIAQIIGRAIADGRTPQQVRADIAARVEAAKARALQFARTAITTMAREARMAETEFAQALLGIKLGRLWASAFKATTRPHHAARHGRVYTTSEVRAFYAQGVNRINCYCSTTECMLDADGKPMLTDALKLAMAKERSAWELQTAP